MRSISASRCSSLPVILFCILPENMHVKPATLVDADTVATAIITSRRYCCCCSQSLAIIKRAVIRLETNRFVEPPRRFVATDATDDSCLHAVRVQAAQGMQHESFAQAFATKGGARAYRLELPDLAHRVKPADAVGGKGAVWRDDYEVTFGCVACDAAHAPIRLKRDLRGMPDLAVNVDALLKLVFTSDGAHNPSLRQLRFRNGLAEITTHVQHIKFVALEALLREQVEQGEIVLKRGDCVCRLRAFLRYRLTLAHLSPCHHLPKKLAIVAMLRRGLHSGPMLLSPCKADQFARLVFPQSHMRRRVEWSVLLHPPYEVATCQKLSCISEDIQAVTRDFRR